MNSTFIQEPELEFASGRHVDIRFGVMNFGPLDVLRSPSPKNIRLGVVGTAETTEGFSRWVDSCRGEIPAKNSNRPNLFPPFPGFHSDSIFEADLSIDPSNTASFTSRDMAMITAASEDTTQRAVARIVEYLTQLAEKAAVDVLVCAPPTSLLDAISRDEDEHGNSQPDFHDLLKGRCMPLGKPVQIILPSTYDRTAKPHNPRTRRPRQIQDEATRAWNFHIAMYYKAGWIPWRLIRDASQFTTCYIGVSFYFSLDKSEVGTSIAHVFNERGEGIIVRGAGAQVSRHDRQPHLTENDAAELIRRALERYRDEHHTYPARVVIHKTSSYSAGERAGFSGMATQLDLASLDLLTLAATGLRLFRNGAYPPLRGTAVQLSPNSHLFYTRGSVDFFATYPGMYVPAPILVDIVQSNQTARFLCNEVLALSKMNWNNTQFDGAEPITIRAARQVSTILKYVAPEAPIATRYSSYM